MPIRFDPRVLSQEVGYYLLRSASVQEQVKAATYGTALMQINIGDLKKLLLLVPPLSAQQALGEQLISAHVGIDALCLKLEAKLAALTELKQSLLQKAFAGELT